MVYLQDQRGMDINRKWGTTYRVPATLVLICVMLPGKNFANPKSAILGLRFLSRRMLLALMSRWTIGGWISS